MMILPSKSTVDIWAKTFFCNTISGKVYLIHCQSCFDCCSLSLFKDLAQRKVYYLQCRFCIMFFLSEDSYTTADLFSSLCIIIFQLAFNYFVFPEATCSKWKQSQFNCLGALSNKALPAALIQLCFLYF